MNKILFAIVLLFVSIDNAQPASEHHHYKDDDNKDFDMLIYTQEWPETVCREWVRRDPSHTCTMPKNADSWGIHGIWPDKLHTRGPEFCNRSWHFDPEQIRPIETQLTDTWTNVEGQTEKYSFWAHEWTKHGTCAAALEPLNSEYKYFSMGLKWFEKYNMGTILSKSGIVPDNFKPYELTDIYNAVKNTLGINPSIQCRREDGKNYLVEIRICMDKTFELRDCDGNSWMKNVHNIITNCDVSHGIYYLHNQWPPKTMYVHMYNLISWLDWFTF